MHKIYPNSFKQGVNVTAWAQIQLDRANNTDKKMVTGVLMWDLSAAFDTLDHEILHLYLLTNNNKSKAQVMAGHEGKVGFVLMPLPRPFLT